LQGDILYATQDAESNSLFVELPRIFFDGSLIYILQIFCTRSKPWKNLAPLLSK